MRETVIISAARTAIAKENGALKDVPPENLAALVMRETVNRAKLDKPEMIDEVIYGHCFGAPGCLGRVALLQAGLPEEIPATTVDRQCGSGSTSLNIAAAHIWAGIGDLYLVGGAESITRQPYLLEKPQTAYQRFPPKWIMPRPVSPPKIGDPPMGITAENVAERFNVSREEQDELSYLSQVKAAKAIQEEKFKEQIVPVEIPQKKGDPVIFDTDEHPRPNTTLEALSALPPVFKKDGSVTAGNSSGINDAAAALLVASTEKAAELNAPPLARVVSFGASGVDPHYMGLGPIEASRRALAAAGLTMEQMDVIELNEAFAAQAVACCRELDIDWRDRDKFNPNGGAIALGHPIGATLAILIIKAVYELQHQNGKYALITACCGGGQGVATIIEK